MSHRNLHFCTTELLNSTLYLSCKCGALYNQDKCGMDHYRSGESTDHLILWDRLESDEVGVGGGGYNSSFASNPGLPRSAPRAVPLSSLMKVLRAV